jgi:hypothetical protein
MYTSGQGVKRDYEKAMEWFRKAADGGFNEARREMIDIAELLEDRSADGRHAESGATTAQENMPLYTYEDLMLASWNRDDQPVAYLPSAINNCRVEDTRVVCFSDDQSRNTAAGTIKYKTRAIVHGISEDGSFEVIYRNLVIDAARDVTREKAGSEEVLGSISAGPEKMNYAVKTGWGNEHSLQCKFQDTSTLSCLKDKTHAFLLQSPQALAAGK